MKSLVTGGAGFIGSNLVETLLGVGHTVVLLIMRVLMHMINPIGIIIQLIFVETSGTML